MARLTLLNSVLLLALASPGHGQVIPHQGDRVRVRVERSWTTGEYQGATADRVLLKYGSDSTVIEVSRDAISELEVSRGRHRRFGRNFGITLATTAVLGAAVGGLLWSPCEDTGLSTCSYSPRNRTESFVGGAILGGILGLPVGILIGLQRDEEWVPAAFSETGASRIVLRPLVRHGVGVEGSLTVRSF